MGNSFGTNGLFEPTRFVAEVAQVVVHDGHEPIALADLSDAHVLPRKHLACVNASSRSPGVSLIGCLAIYSRSSQRPERDG